MIIIRKQSLELLFKIIVQPRASRTMIAGCHGDAVKLRLTAPPVDGAANKSCLKFLSKWLDVPKSSLSIVSGETARNKTISVRCADGHALEKEHRRLTLLFNSVSADSVE